MTDRQRVAILIPCYDDGEFVTGAVDSAMSGPEAFEVVVVDDGSSDPATKETLHRLERDGVRVVRHERNRGLVAARTTGLHATSARYVFPLDADDLAVSSSLSLMADRLEATPDASVCFGDYEEFGDRELVRAVPETLDAYRLVYTNEYPVSALFRRTVLEAVGGWRRPLHGYEDWNLWLTLAERGHVGVHAGPGVITYRRRLHGVRMLQRGRRRHAELYAELMADHAALLADIRHHRRRSTLSPARKALYPLIYGGRRRFGWEPKVKVILDRLGVWTLRR